MFPISPFEDSWPMSLLFVVLGVGLGYAYLRSPRQIFAALSAACFLLAGLIFGADIAITTSGEKIAKLLDESVSSALKGDAEGVLKIISDRCEADGADKTRMLAELKRIFAEAKFESISLNGREQHVLGTKGETRFVAVITGKSNSVALQRIPVRLALTWQEEPAGWRVVKIARYEPISAKNEIPLLTR